MIKLCHPFWPFLRVILDSWPAPLKPSDRSADQLLAATAETGPAGLSSLPQLVGRRYHALGHTCDEGVKAKFWRRIWGIEKFWIVVEALSQCKMLQFLPKIAVRATFKSLDHPRFIRVKETHFAENPAESILPPGHCHCSFPLSCPAWLTSSVLWDPLKSQENRTILKRRCTRQTEAREKNRGISKWRS